MKRRAFMGLGAASLGVGTLYGTGAFSSVNAGRGVSVNAADNPDALLGVKGIDEEPVEESPIEFFNNTGVEMNVHLTSEGVEFDPSSFNIQPHTDQSQEVDFQGEGSATIEASLGDDGTVGTITLERSFENPLLRKVNGSPVGGGNNGRYEFRLDNDGDVDLEITGLRVIRVETENASANEIANGLDIDGTELIDTLDVGEDTSIVEFNQTVSIDSQTQSGLFEFKQIRSPDENGNMDTGGATAEIEIRYIESGGDSDNSFTTTITLIDE